MRFDHIQKLDEGVVLNGAPETAAFVIAVAETYDAAPRQDAEGEHAWAALNAHNANVLFKQLQPKVKIEFTPEDPYAINGGDESMAVRLMLYDMLINHRLMIYTGHSDDHPHFTAKENVIFRTVHDYYTHAKLLKPFALGLKKVLAHKHRLPSESELRELLPHIDLAKAGNIGHGFTLRGELNAYATHVKLAPQDAAAALFTEVVGQVCYYAACHAFPTQKAAVLHGFDFQNVGRALPGSPQQKRMSDLARQIDAGEPILDMAIRGHGQVRVSELLAQVGGRA